MYSVHKFRNHLFHRTHITDNLLDCLGILIVLAVKSSHADHIDVTILHYLNDVGTLLVAISVPDGMKCLLILGFSIIADVEEVFGMLMRIYCNRPMSFRMGISPFRQGL